MSYRYATAFLHFSTKVKAFEQGNPTKNKSDSHLPCSITPYIHSNYWGVRLFKIHALSISGHAISKNVAVHKSDSFSVRSMMLWHLLHWDGRHWHVLMQCPKGGGPRFTVGALSYRKIRAREPPISWGPQNFMTHGISSTILCQKQISENTQSSCCDWFFIYRSNHEITHWRSWAKISHSDTKKYVNTC